MSKSDQFAVPADAPATVGKPGSPVRRVFGWGCAGVGIIVAVFVISAVAKFQAAQQNQPVQAQVLNSLAGVPIYPGATFDRTLTGTASSGLAAAQGVDAYKMRTVAGLRTPDEPAKVLAFYDSNMRGYGFTQTTLGGVIFKTKDYLDSASYTSPDTLVIVQMNRESGEDNQLLVYRFDRSSRSALKQPGNVVTPEDFKKAQEDAKKKKAMEGLQDQKVAPKK